MVRYLGLMAAWYFLWMGADIVLDQSAPLVLRIIGLVISGGFVALLVRWYGREVANSIARETDDDARLITCVRLVRNLTTVLPCRTLRTPRMEMG